MNRPPVCISAPADFHGSGHYRVIFPLQTADALGYIQVRMPDQPVFMSIEFLQRMRPDSMLVQRSNSPAQVKIIKEIKDKTDVFLVLEVDDWFEQCPKYSPHYKAASSSETIKNLRRAISLCGRLDVTNDLLANVYGGKIDTHIIPNYMSEALWNSVYTAGRIPVARLDGKPRIGWCGGVGHLGDLELLRLIAKELGDSVRWVLAGAIPPEFVADIPNVSVPEPCTQKQFPHMLYGLDLDLALAPLIDNKFNQAKSSLKVLEYGVCGYPTIASNVKPYRDVVLRENCPITLLPWDVDQWVKVIKDKVADLTKLKDEGQQLKDWVWDNYKLEDHLDKYSALLSPDGTPFIPSKVTNKSNIVDIIVTTRNNPKVVERCINSVIASKDLNKTPINIVISDNASNDPELMSYFETLQNIPYVEFNKHEEDVGYIKNVNSAIELHPDRDVVTLNSDTLVNGDWVDRMAKNAADPRCATITAMTNNGTVVSYPNPSGSALNAALVRLYDDLASKLDHPPVTLPSSINHCTYMRREAIADVGLFDEHAFGRGYGEENDWSLRALKRFWTHGAACNVYIGHEGNATFGAEQDGLRKQAYDVLSAKWPAYFELVEKWGKENHLLPIRQKLDIASIKLTTPRPRILYITHSLGGGVETHLQQLLAKDSNAVVARFSPDQPGMFKLEIPNEQYYNLPAISTRFSSIDYIASLFNDMKVNKIYVETTFNYFDYNIPTWIQNVAKKMDITYQVMLHDYWFLCPRLRMIGNGTPNSYCGEPDTDGCNNCVMTHGSVTGQVDITAWRKMGNEFLLNSYHVYSPSRDLISRYKSYFPAANIDFLPHDNSIEIGSWKDCKADFSTTTVNVAVIGFLFTDKGSNLIVKCADYCRDNNVPIKFTVFGVVINTEDGMPKAFESHDNLKILGKYEDESKLQQLMQNNKCHVSLFLPQWPETYSYTLSHAFRAGLWPVAPDIGAFPERIAEMKFGTIIPFDRRHDPEFVINAIIDAVSKNK